MQDALSHERSTSLDYPNSPDYPAVQQIVLRTELLRPSSEAR
jgi:hypothetical protein